MKRKFVTGVLILVVGLLVAGWLVHMQSRKYWEATLQGPFYGREYYGELVGEPTSCIDLFGGRKLCIYHGVYCGDPVLTLQDASGSNLWARLLIPETSAPDGTVRRGRVNHVKLRGVHSDNAGLKVFISCDWDWGGNEAGIIYINPDYSFQNFALGW